MHPFRLIRQCIIRILPAPALMHACCSSGVISEKNAEDIVAGLTDIEKTIEEGNFTFDINDEDIHMSVEKVLTQNIGDAALACTPAAAATTR